MDSEFGDVEYSLALVGEGDENKENEVNEESQAPATMVEEETNNNPLPNPKNPDPVDSEWSDEPQIGTPVIWGDQITNTIKKLKSLTFFAIGSTPIPAPPNNKIRNNQGQRGQGNKKRGKGTGGGRGRKNKNLTDNQRGQGGGVNVMGQEENNGLDGVEVIGEINHPNSVDFVSMGCDEVANFECVESEIKFEEGGERRVGRVKRGGDKPNHTYTDIITKALEENPDGLTVSEIYEYISREYPYFQPNDDRWKNSVRHNLSISPYFHKGDKSKFGAGHVWTISENCKDIRPIRRRSGPLALPHNASASDGCVMDLSKLKTETDYAVASILTDYSRACNGSGRSVECKGVEPMSNESYETSTQELDSSFISGSFVAQESIQDSTMSELGVSEIEIELEGYDIQEGTLGVTHEIVLDSSTEVGVCFVQKNPEEDVVSVSAGEALFLNLQSYLHQTEEAEANVRNLEDSWTHGLYILNHEDGLPPISPPLSSTSSSTSTQQQSQI